MSGDHMHGGHMGITCLLEGLFCHVYLPGQSLFLRCRVALQRKGTPQVLQVCKVFGRLCPS